MPVHNLHMLSLPVFRQTCRHIGEPRLRRSVVPGCAFGGFVVTHPIPPPDWSLWPFPQETNHLAARTCITYLVKCDCTTKKRWICAVGLPPYSLRAGTDSKLNANVFRTYRKILLSTNPVSLEQMKAYKALGIQNYFTNGWVKGILAKEYPSNKVVLFNEARHFEWWKNNQEKKSASLFFAYHCQPQTRCLV